MGPGGDAIREIHHSDDYEVSLMTHADGGDAYANARVLYILLVIIMHGRELCPQRKRRPRCCQPSS